MRFRYYRNFEKLPSCFTENNLNIRGAYCGFCPVCETEVIEKIRNIHGDIAFSYNGIPYSIDFNDVDNPSRMKTDVFNRYKNIPEAVLKNKIEFLKKYHAINEQQRDESLTTCPFCHSDLELPKVAGFWVFGKNNIDNVTKEEREAYYQDRKDNVPEDEGDKRTDLLLFRLQQKDKAAAKERYEATYSSYNELDLAFQPHAENIKNDIEQLKQHIFNLLTLETNIYSVGTRLVELYTKQPSYGRSVVRRNAMRAYDLRKAVQELEVDYNESLNALDAIRLGGVEKIQVTKPKEPLKPSEPTLEKPGLFNRKAVLANNAWLTEHYEKALQDYETKYAAYRADMEQCIAKEQQLNAEAHEKHAQAVTAAENEVEKWKAELEQATSAVEEKIKEASALPSAEAYEKQVLDEEIVQAEAMLKNLLECRNKLYAYNIVFDKYRNLVALSSIYEYLIAGRCDSLEGPNGAYNIFEAECRANEVIRQLSVVIESLEQIKEGQGLLYKQLSRVNSNLKTINSTMDSMVESLKGIEANTQDMGNSMEVIAANTEVIAHNTATTAYYSKINAELTDSLGYLVALQ